MKYHQCRLSEVGGNRQTVGWIEGRGAKLGAHVEMKDFGGAFFEVLSVSEMSFDDTALREKQKNDRNAFASIAA